MISNISNFNFQRPQGTPPPPPEGVGQTNVNGQAPPPPPHHHGTHDKGHRPPPPPDVNQNQGFNGGLGGSFTGMEDLLSQFASLGYGGQTSSLLQSFLNF